MRAGQLSASKGNYLQRSLQTALIIGRSRPSVRSFKCCVNLLCAGARCVVMRRELQQSGHVCRAATLLALQHTHLTAPETLTLHRYMRSKVNIYIYPTFQKSDYANGAYKVLGNKNTTTLSFMQCYISNFVLAR